MSAAISFLAGMGAGYLSAKDKALEQERQAARDKRDQTLFDQQQSDRAQALADKQALRDAGAPVAVVPETQAAGVSADQADMDQPAAAVAPDAQPATRYKVGAKDFAGDGVGAAAEAAKLSSPDGVRTRTMAALAAQGNVVGADQLRTSGLQAESAQLNIDKAKREEANALFDQGIHRALSTGGPQGLADFMSESHADGVGGKMKFAAIANPNGKTWQIAQVQDDGTLKPIGKNFTNDENGYAEAGFMLSRAVPDDKKLAHVMAVQEAERKAAHDEASLAIQQQNADTQEQWRKDQAANMREQRRLQEEHLKKAGAGQPVQVTLKDMRDFESDLAGYIKDQFPVKDGADANERASMNAQATAIKATANSIFQTNAAHGIPLTAGTVMQAMELAKDPANQRVYADPATGQKYMGVMVNGTPVAVSGALQQPQVQPAQAGASTNAPSAAPTQAPSPAAMAAQGVQAAPAPAAARPMNSVDQIQAQGVKELQPLAAQLKQANAQYVAAAQSGDQRSIAQYMQAKEALRVQLEKQVTDRFGNAAPRVLQQLMAQ